MFCNFRRKLINLVKTAKDLPEKEPEYDTMIAALREDYKTSRWHQQRDRHEVKFTLELYEWFDSQADMGEEVELPAFVQKRIRMQYVVCKHGWHTALKMERRESGLDVGLKIPSPDPMRREGWTGKKATGSYNKKAQSKNSKGGTSKQ